MAEESPKAPKKRRLRSPGETLRERAVKTQEAAQRPTRRSRSRAAIAKTSKPLGFVGRILKPVSRFVIPPYFRNSWRELKLVTWPSRKETRQLTVAVVIFSVIFGGLVAIVDYGLDKLFREVLLK